MMMFYHRPKINKKWIAMSPVVANVVDVSLPTPFLIQRLHLFVRISQASKLN